MAVASAMTCATHTHTHTHTHTTHTYTQTHADTHTDQCPCPCLCLHLSSSRSRLDTHTHTHIHTHTRMRALPRQSDTACQCQSCVQASSHGGFTWCDTVLGPAWWPLSGCACVTSVMQCPTVRRAPVSFSTHADTSNLHPHTYARTQHTQDTHTDSTCHCPCTCRVHGIPMSPSGACNVAPQQAPVCASSGTVVPLCNQTHTSRDLSGALNDMLRSDRASGVPALADSSHDSPKHAKASCRACCR